SPSSVRVDSLGNVYFSSAFSGSLSWGGATFTSAGASDALVSKLNPSGNVIWAKQAGFIFDDRCNDLALDSAGNVVLAGYFYDTTKFDTNTITGNGDDVFIAKLGNNTIPLYPIIQTQPQSLCVSPGATANFGVVASGAPP